MNERFSTPPKDKAELIHRIQEVRAELENFIGTLSSEALTQPGPDGGWSVLDHLIHLAEWRWKLLAMIQGRPGHEGLGIEKQTYETAGQDAVNAILYERNRQRPNAGKLAAYRESHEAVLEAIQQLHEADLQRVYDLTDPTDQRTLLEGIIGNTYGHDLEHLGWIKEQ
jgi:uncharacterized damage-inducible protein DinB